MLSALKKRKFASTPYTSVASRPTAPVDCRDRKIAPTSELRSTSRRPRSTV